jgi:hypothetical protein
VHGLHLAALLLTIPSLAELPTISELGGGILTFLALFSFMLFAVAPYLVGGEHLPAAMAKNEHYARLFWMAVAGLDYAPQIPEKPRGVVLAEGPGVGTLLIALSPACSSCEEVQQVLWSKLKELSTLVRLELLFVPVRPPLRELCEALTALSLEQGPMAALKLYREGIHNQVRRGAMEALAKRTGVPEEVLKRHQPRAAELIDQEVVLATHTPWAVFQDRLLIGAPTLRGILYHLRSIAYNRPQMLAELLSSRARTSRADAAEPFGVIENANTSPPSEEPNHENPADPNLGKISTPTAPHAFPTRSDLAQEGHDQNGGLR